MVERISAIRARLEGDWDALAMALVQPSRVKGPPSDLPVDSPLRLLVLQTWDVVESTMFQIVVKEAAASCTLATLEMLKTKLFTPSPSAPAAGLQRTPPLATILPGMLGYLTHIL
jgi:hypothetical protein